MLFASSNQKAQGHSGSGWMDSHFGGRSQHNNSAHGFSLAGTSGNRSGNHSGSSTGWRDQPTFPLTSNHNQSAQSLVGTRSNSANWWEPNSTSSAWRTDDRLASSGQATTRLGSSWTGSSLWGGTLGSSSHGRTEDAGARDLRGGLGHSFNGGKTDAHRSSPLWSQNWRQVWPEVAARLPDRNSRSPEASADSRTGFATGTHAERRSPLWSPPVAERTSRSLTPEPRKLELGKPEVKAPAKNTPDTPTPMPPTSRAPKNVTPKPDPKPVETSPPAKPKPDPAPPQVETPPPGEVSPPVTTPPPAETPPPIETPPPVRTPPTIEMPPPPIFSAQQRADLTEMHRIATSGRVTPADQQALNAIYGRFRLDETTLAELQGTARTVAAQLLSPTNAEFATARREWRSYSPEQRQEVLAKFVGTMNDTLGLDVEARFFNTPPVGKTMTHGFYSTGTNSINLNINPASIDSFGYAVKTIFHEMIHAQYFDKTKGLTPDTALALVQSGDIDVTTAMAYFNARPGMYLTTPQVTRVDYMLNPHEQLAFTGQYFWEKEAAARGLTDSSPTFTDANPLFEHLRKNRFA